MDREELLGTEVVNDGQPLRPILDEIARRMLVLIAWFTPIFFLVRLGPVLVDDPPLAAWVRFFTATTAIVLVVIAALYRERLRSQQIGWMIAILAGIISLGGVYRLGTNTALVSFIFISLMSLALFVGRRTALVAGVALWSFAILMTFYRNQEQFADFDQLMDVNSGVIGIGSGFGAGILVVLMVSEILPRLLLSIEQSMRERTKEATRRWYAEARSEAVEHRWQRYLRGAPMGVALLDDAGKIISWSRLNEDYLGLPASRIVGSSLEDLLRALDTAHPLIAKVAALYNNGTPITDALMDFATEQGVRSVLIQGTAIYDEQGAIEGAFVCGLDMTTLLGGESLTPTGESAPSRRQNPLVQMTNKLLELRSALMTAGLSAETVVQGLAAPGVLSKDDMARANDLIARGATWIEQQRRAAMLADAAFAMITDKVERDTPQPAARVAETALAIMRSRVERDGIEVDFDDAFAEGALVAADAVLLRQILINLISNAREAIERSSKATQRRIYVRVETDGEAIQFVVEDSAGSILPVNREVYFSPGYSTKGRASESGKGLYVSRHTAEQMGGSLDVEQGRDGLRFVLRLLRVAVSEEETAHAS